MASGPNRRTFLRGAAGVAGLGAVGAFSPEVELLRAAIALPAPKTITLHVHYKNEKLTCPDTIAEPLDTVVWEPSTGVDCIRQIVFKGPSPFDKVLVEGECSEHGKNVAGKVRLNTDPKEYTYMVVAKVDDGSTKTLDPDLDII